MIWALYYSLLLLMFLLGPLWYKKPAAQVEQGEENLRLYQERCADLAQSELDDAQKQACGWSLIANLQLTTQRKAQ